MTKLSVTVITLNEEKNIDRCLRSVKEIADEIIVVDSLSTDKTKDISLSHGATFIEQPFLGHIQQKNFAVSKATNMYVLSLDADELLSDELKNSILMEKQKGFPSLAYSMNRLNNYCGKWIHHGDYYPDRKIRLWRKDAGVWGGENPHDKVIVTGDTTAQQLKGDLLHYSFSTVEQHRRQMQYFSTIAANAMYYKGKKRNYAKLLLNPAWSFLRGYLIKGGLKDGAAGLRIARMNAWYTWLKYKKLIDLHNHAIKV
jgi:glycosyltransferase involved in cell wall biosynthesis